MTSKENFNNTAKDILACVGGKENVTSVAHCATRLRLVLHDDKKINLEKIVEINLVKGCLNNGGQFQIILGTGIVDAVYKEFAKLTYISEVSKEELKKVSTTKLNIIQRILSALLGITEPAMFGINLKLKYPFIGALIGSAVGSAYATFMKVLSLSQGPAGLPGIIVIRPQSM